MQQIILDLEWNQKYYGCDIIRGTQLTGEIIQIGAVKVDAEYRPIDTFKILIKPIYYRILHRKVAKLTGLTREDLNYGFPFPRAFKFFRQWCGKDFCFLTWGPDDLQILSENMSIHQLSPSWIPVSYDVQRIYSRWYLNDDHAHALLEAVESFGEPASEAHDALHDSMNTAAVCRHLDMSAAIRDYGEVAPLDRLRPLLQTDLDVSYVTRDDAILAESTSSFVCPFCGSQARCSNWLTKKASRISLGKCDAGDEFFVRLNFSFLGENKYRPRRLVYELTPERKDAYAALQARAVSRSEALCTATDNI